MARITNQMREQRIQEAVNEHPEAIPRVLSYEIKKYQQAQQRNDSGEIYNTTGNLLTLIPELRTPAQYRKIFDLQNLNLTVTAMNDIQGSDLPAESVPQIVSTLFNAPGTREMLNRFVERNDLPFNVYRALSENPLVQTQAVTNPAMPPRILNELTEQANANRTPENIFLLSQIALNQNLPKKSAEILRSDENLRTEEIAFSLVGSQADDEELIRDISSLYRPTRTPYLFVEIASNPMTPDDVLMDIERNTRNLREGTQNLQSIREIRDALFSNSGTPADTKASIFFEDSQPEGEDYLNSLRHIEQFNLDPAVYEIFVLRALSSRSWRNEEGLPGIPKRYERMLRNKYFPAEKLRRLTQSRWAINPIQYTPLQRKFLYCHPNMAPDVVEQYLSSGLTSDDRSAVSCILSHDDRLTVNQLNSLLRRNPDLIDHQQWARIHNKLNPMNKAAERILIHNLETNQNLQSDVVTALTRGGRVAQVEDTYNPDHVCLWKNTAPALQAHLMSTHPKAETVALAECPEIMEQLWSHNKKYVAHALRNAMRATASGADITRITNITRELEAGDLTGASDLAGHICAIASQHPENEDIQLACAQILEDNSFEVERGARILM